MTKLTAWVSWGTAEPNPIVVRMLVSVPTMLLRSWLTKAMMFDATSPFSILPSPPTRPPAVVPTVETTFPTVPRVLLSVFPRVLTSPPAPGRTVLTAAPTVPRVLPTVPPRFPTVPPTVFVTVPRVLPTVFPRVPTVETTGVRIPLKSPVIGSTGVDVEGALKNKKMLINGFQILFSFPTEINCNDHENCGSQGEFHLDSFNL